MKNKPKLFMMIGLPGSGKSTYTKQISEKYNANIHSADDIRMELTGDVNCQNENVKVFNTLHKRIKEDLRNNKNTIYDATNISYKRRKAFLEEFKKIDCEKIAVLMATPYEVCLKNNIDRRRNVPKEVIKKMYLNFNIPYWYEGWDTIHIEYPSFFQKKNCEDFISDYITFPQENSHHTLTLGRHCDLTEEFIIRNFERLIHKENYDLYVLSSAAFIHDNGKPFCKSYKNSKGEYTEEAHYYQHHLVGAYDSLFYNLEDKVLDIAILIQWHMQPYNWDRDELNGERQKEKYRKLWGEKLYEQIMFLHEADKSAH